MKDFFGNEVAICDMVAFKTPYCQGLTKAEIVGMKKKSLMLYYEDGHGKPHYVNRSPDLVVKKFYP